MVHNDIGKTFRNQSLCIIELCTDITGSKIAGSGDLGLALTTSVSIKEARLFNNLSLIQTKEFVVDKDHSTPPYDL